MVQTLACEAHKSSHSCLHTLARKKPLQDVLSYKTKKKDEISGVRKTVPLWAKIIFLAA